MTSKPNLKQLINRFIIVSLIPLYLPLLQAHADEREPSKHSPQLRIATFNASLNRSAAGELIAQLSTPDNAQAQAVAEIIQRVNPDIVLINEFDYDTQGQAASLFQENYLARAQHGAAALNYPYRYLAPSNTGLPSGFDLDNDGRIGGPGDALGFGFFPGQYAMVVYSKFPIDTHAARSFQRFLWRDMPGALLPDDPATAEAADWYSAQELQVLRLSSKSHWDIPVKIGEHTVHVLASHPTPPVFDGAEDRNGRRNHDEIRFWADYIDPQRGNYIYDDRGEHGALEDDEAAFVILGDQNADPLDGDSTANAIDQLLQHPRINTRTTPHSEGAVDAAQRQGGINAYHRGEAAQDTADFQDLPGPGNLRTDYVLASDKLLVQDAGVFWPRATDPLFRLVGDYPFPSSDHRLVWIDVSFPEHD